ncbi:MAG: hypothetical protein JJV94_05580 [Sulfurospirillum sp.]|nr:hypothetical protein [Sulfurospirillum sp.]
MVAIIFEGKSDKDMLDEFCNYHDLPKDKIKYFNFEGKDNIFEKNHEYYKEIKDGINDLQSIDKMLIIVDADDKNDENKNRGFKASEDKLKELIANFKFKIPIDYYIMCDENEIGNLESLLLSMLDEGQQNCIKAFKKCYKHVLSDKWVYNSFYKHKKNKIDFDHNNFKPLKMKLTDLFRD